MLLCYWIYGTLAIQKQNKKLKLDILDKNVKEIKL